MDDFNVSFSLLYLQLQSDHESLLPHLYQPHIILLYSLFKYMEILNYSTDYNFQIVNNKIKLFMEYESVTQNVNAKQLQHACLS
jgi:hypothetical protein